MSHTIPAIFESGVFRPLAPVLLEPGTRVVLDLSPLPAAPSDPKHDPARWKKFLDDMEAMPNGSPNDGFSNRDHDRLIYGV
jgi:predicted DNA-binding antitoxin AbrB/MazE fold protein